MGTQIRIIVGSLNGLTTGDFLVEPHSGFIVGGDDTT